MRFWISAQPSVSSYIHALVRDHFAAKDILQETALVLFRRFEEYDSDRPFVAWALGMARWQILGFHRDKARTLITFDSELLDDFTSNWAELSPRISDHEHALKICIRSLGERASSLVKQRYYEGRTAEDIAKRNGATGASIRVALQRIREQLRNCVNQRISREGGLT